MATKTMTGKEAHEYLLAVRDAGGHEGFVEGAKERKTKGQLWSELYAAVEDVKRTDNVPADLVKRIHAAYPAEAEPTPDAPTP